MQEKEKRRYSIYIHLFPDGKRYVGCTRQNPQTRWRYGDGYRNAKRLYSAILKCGWDNIQHIIVSENLSEEEARTLERELITKYKTQDPLYGYNTKNGGQIFDKHTDEFMKNLHERMKGNKYCEGRKLRPSHILALRKSRIGVSNPNKNKGKHIYSEEQKAVMSERQKKRWEDPEYRRIQSEHHKDVNGSNNPMYGKHHSEQTKRKIGEQNRGRKRTPEQIVAMSERAKKKGVIQLDLNGSIVAEYASVKEAAIAINAKPQNIGFVCKHGNRTCKGYYWRYADDHS